MMRPSFLLLNAFVAVYEEHSFTGAAAREHSTQPGISQHIRELEEMLGVLLFDRERGKVNPTPAAHSFYSRCNRILALHAEAIQEVQQFRSNVEGAVMIGVSPVFTQAVLGSVLQSFIADHPNVAVRIVDGYPDTLIGMVVAGELDFAIMPTVPFRSSLRARPFICMQEVLISKKSERLANMQPMPIHQCGPLRLILPRSHHVRRHSLDAYIAGGGVDVIGVIEMDTVPGSLSVVLEGEGWSTVLPSLSVAHEVNSDRFTINPLVEPELVLEFSLVEHSRLPLTPVAAKFAQALSSACDTAQQNFDRQRLATV